MVVSNEIQKVECPTIGSNLGHASKSWGPIWVQIRSNSGHWLQGPLLGSVLNPKREVCSVGD